MTGRDLEPTWLGMEGIFGGYVLAVAVDAVALEGYRPQSMTVVFVSTVQPGETELVLEEAHRGRSTGSRRIAMIQDGRLRAHGIASLVRVGDDHPIWEPRVDPACWGDPGQAPLLVPNYEKLAYTDHLEQRQLGTDSMDDGAAGWVRSISPAGAALDPHARLALYLDVLPPGVFALDPRPRFVPSLEMTAHFSPRAAQAIDPGAWFVVRNKAAWSSKEFCVDECTLHDQRGGLVAQLRQGRAVRW